MRSLVALLVLGISAPVPARPQGSGSTQSAPDLAKALQAKYDTVRDFSADFSHMYKGGVLKKTVMERGTVIVKKPGKMRWTYSSPEEKVFVSDGQRLYSYVKADKQVMVTNLPPQDEATAAVLFLAGRGNLTRDFTVSHADTVTAAAGAAALKLVPRQKERDYDWLVLVVDRQTLQIRSLVTGDQQGGTSSFTFTNLKENIGATDATFTFKVPRGVEVVGDAKASR